ncbi:hypothetical protein QTP86_014397 [Hemibagrus guttatus]|nr:hypothetical protein QTP86_014397 [Hemibagrus guttatus]
MNVGVKKYEQATSGPLINQANYVINRMFPNVYFSAHWVFVATWKNVPVEMFNSEITSFQVVLASDGGRLSFILMNYETIPSISPGYWLAGYGIDNSDFVTIPVNNAHELPSSSNVNIPGRWAFQFTDTTTTPDTTTPDPLALLDWSHHLSGKKIVDESFVYFLSQLNIDGYLAFFVPNINDELPDSQLGKDLIAPMWTDLDFYVGVKKYEQATSGPLIDQANQEINRMFPNVYFSANWVFVATWENVPIEFSYSEVRVNTNDSVRVLQSTEYSSNVPGRWAFQFTDTTTPAPCQSLNCASDEVCRQINGVYNCACGYITRSSLNIYDAIVTCQGSTASLSLSRCQLFEAGYSANVLHLIDPTCKGEIQNNRLVFKYDINVNMCGTTLESNATHIIFKNSAGTINSTDLISLTGGLNIAISCVYPIIQSISMPTDIEAKGGCPNPNDDTVSVLQNGVSTSSHFSFRMFSFTSFSTKIYLHCQVHLCLQKKGNCALNCPLVLNRRCRSVDFYDSAAISMKF